MSLDRREPTSYEQLKRDANNVANMGGRLIWYAFCFVMLSCVAYVVIHAIDAIF